MEVNVLAIIEQRYGSLTKTHRKLADYVAENIYALPFLSINELSKKAGVSTASITRFTRELSFAGYADFNRHISNTMQRDLTPFGNFKEAITSSEPAESADSDFLRQSIADHQASLGALYTEQLEGNFREVVRMATQCKRLYIAGFSTSFCVAHYLWSMLQRIRSNVFLLQNIAGEMYTGLSEIKPSDCLIAIGYSRYMRMTVDAVNLFHDKGCTVASITDSHTSPLAIRSSHVLLAPNTNAYSMVGGIMLANSIATAVGKQTKKTALKRMESQDKINIDHDTYI